MDQEKSNMKQRRKEEAKENEIKLLQEDFGKFMTKTMKRGNPMNREQPPTNVNQRDENVTLKCMCWNVRGWRGKNTTFQENEQNKKLNRGMQGDNSIRNTSK